MLNQVIDEANIQLKGFTVEELKTILSHIREVEAHRASRFVFVKLNTPTLSVDEAKDIIKEIWPR